MSTEAMNLVERRKRVHRVLLDGHAKIQDHCEIFQELPDIYADEVLQLLEKEVELTSQAKVRAAALLWRTSKRENVEAIMKFMNVAEVLNMVKILDADRKIKQLEKKLQKVKKRRKVNEIKKAKNSLEAEVRLPIEGSSATSALATRVKKWAKTFSAETLEFYLLNFPREPWKELADVVHFAPKDFNLEYFLPCVFGASAPEGSLLFAMDTVKDGKNVAAVLKEYPQLSQYYSYLRTKFGSSMSDESKAALAALAPLTEVVWFYEELDHPGLDNVIKNRLVSGEEFVDTTGKGRDSFGKLMERLLFLKKRRVSFLPMLEIYTEEMLAKIKIPTTKKVVVLGDASSSMQVAVEAATIVGSVINSALNGTLSFFNSADFKPPVQPRTVADVLKVSDAVRASGSTAPVASLWPYLEKKIVRDLFIVVTDEEENTGCNGEWLSSQIKHDKGTLKFAAAFKRYLEEVNPKASVFFVSFLNPSKEGKMFGDMKSEGLEEKVKQFRMDPKRPDLSKLTSLLAMLAIEAGSGAEEAISQCMKTCLEADVPVVTKDGTLLVTKDQEVAVNSVFTDTESISMATLLEALPKLRQIDDENASMNTDWSFVSAVKEK